MNSGRVAAGGDALTYLLKKMMKKALAESAGADALRGAPCSAHISG